MLPARRSGCEVKATLCQLCHVIFAWTIAPAALVIRMSWRAVPNSSRLANVKY
jgi:hypothetical protein